MKLVNIILEEKDGLSMDKQKIGTFISSCRKEKGLTQAQLAEILGVSDKSISRCERGIHLPDASLYTPLCEILGITINEFFLGEYETEHHEVVPQVLKEDYHKMQRNERWNIALFIMSMLSVFWIIFIWHIDLGWLMLEEDLAPFANMYYLSYGYWLAYYLVFKKIKLGYVLMWAIYLILVSGLIAFFGYEWNRMLIHIDFWINSAFTIWGVYNGDIRFFNLLEK